MDLNKLSRGDQVIGVSAIVLFIFSFFNWLGFTGKAGLVTASVSWSAWHFTITLLAVLLGLVMLAYVVLKALGVEIPAKFGNVTLAQILLGVAAVAFLFVLIKVIAGPNVPGGFSLGHEYQQEPQVRHLRRPAGHDRARRGRVPQLPGEQRLAREAVSVRASASPSEG